MLIARSADPVTVSIQGQYLVRDPKTDKKLAVSKDLIGVRLYIQNDQLKLAGVSFPDRIELHSLSSKNIKINDRFYRGILSVIRNSDNSISIINTLSVDHYLYGVLMKEVGEWWPAEALKAQAVAARTYAMYQIKTQVNQSFDVYTNQFSQMYGGVNSENPRGNTAVNDTRG
ncbi:MAG: SpoIID/LytB domain-containing protein, partial [Candidatus Omnitrophica bacterium]|nr:SpoIID/LytB domain-containing protein [Candidatus Omnitrophota bacterium]